MLLKNLIKNISINWKKIEVSGLSTNSHEVKRNYIFFAIKGNRLNGENFINDAIDKGASVIVCSKESNYKNKEVPVIKTDNIRYLLSEISAKFYKLKPKNIFAVTGTNGKTSVADVFYQILRINKFPAASIGTLGIKYNDKIIKTKLTSPDTISIHKYLSFLKKKKIDNVIIEASSHGIDQKRLHHVDFKAAIFTNFSQDHLDYHKNMKTYLSSKLKLFKEILRKNSTIISDKEIQPFNQLKTIAKKKKLKVREIIDEFEKINNMKTNLPHFKIKNLAMSSIALKLIGLKDERIYEALKKLKDVNGRLEFVKKFSNNSQIFIDYAHTPDALSKTLNALKDNYGDNISIVFGCGGDRDKKKRPLMARIANNFCKKIYITDDNPRGEEPKKIRDELARHIPKDKVFNIGNREMAINKAIQNSNFQEIILVAGKGHEEQQVYKNKIYIISDKKIIKKIKIKKKIFSNKQKKFLQNRMILNKIVKKVNSVNFCGLSIDTRTIKKDNLFLAIKGKKNDGNKYINDAIKKGAGCVATTLTFKTNKTKIIKIKNPVAFLNRFAKLKREQSSANIIAVTGSAGKTSLKNLLKDLLKNFGKTYSSPKSFNNHYGVPISLSNLNYDDKFGVFEVGMSKAGEIKKLSDMIKPHIGVITNIGEAHIENFKNINGIANAKSEIIDKIKKRGTIVLNKDDKFFNFLYKKAKSSNLKICTFGIQKKADIFLEKLIRTDESSELYLNINGRKISFKIKDLNVYNVLAAIAVLSILKIDLKKIKTILKNLELSEGRGKKYLISRYNKKFKLIDESYNANPLSVKNAIKNLSLLKKKKFKKYLLLGDMLELGAKSKKYHEELSKVINNSDIDKVFVKGKKSIFTYKHLKKGKRGNILQNEEDIEIILEKMISNNDYLMIKGSNATGLHNFSKKMIRGT